MRQGDIFVGPSGWSYRSWSQTVVRGVPLKKRLPHMATLFTAVEVNRSFYGQVSRKTYEVWRSETPPSFRFAVKGHRFITHYKRLGGCADSVRRLREQVAGLGDKLAVVLWQLPAHFSVNLERLDDFLGVLGAGWSDTRHAIEFRHSSWFCDEVKRRLAEARVAACLSDAPDFPMWPIAEAGAEAGPDAIITDLVYVRLHGHTRKYASSYARASLVRWAERARAWAGRGLDVHVYFDNDAEGHAITNAVALSAELGLLPAGHAPEVSIEGLAAPRAPGPRLREMDRRRSPM